MAAGGARVRSGPPADPNSARSESRKELAGWTTLPLEGRGRRARAPKFPLVGMTDVESDMWIALWKKPQAVMWERLGLVYQVAAYTRTFCEASMSNANASLKTAALRMEDTLGLSPIGMNQLRWKFAENELAAPRSRKPESEAEAPVRRLRAS